MHGLVNINSQLVNIISRHGSECKKILTGSSSEMLVLSNKIRLLPGIVPAGAVMIFRKDLLRQYLHHHRNPLMPML